MTITISYVNITSYMKATSIESFFHKQPELSQLKEKKMELHTEIIGRGLKIIKFEDADGKKCSIQESSSDGSSKIWFGTYEATVQDHDGNPVSLPKDWSSLGRMHLSQRSVDWLITILYRFNNNVDIRERTFADSYGDDCSIKNSLSFGNPKIWLGNHNVSFAEDSEIKHLPNGLSAFARMHLDQELVAQLIPFLKRFIQTGEL